MTIFIFIFRPLQYAPDKTRNSSTDWSILWFCDGLEHGVAGAIREHQEFYELDRKVHSASHQENSWENWHRTDDVLLYVHIISIYIYIFYKVNLVNHRTHQLVVGCCSSALMVRRCCVWSSVVGQEGGPNWENNFPNEQLVIWCMVVWVVLVVIENQWKSETSFGDMGGIWW